MARERLSGWLALLGVCWCSWTRCEGAPVPSLAVGQNFAGSRFSLNSSATPPDSNGAIGPSHFVEFINGSFAVHNKSNGQNVLRISDVRFWTNAGVTLPAHSGVSDPRLIYDPALQRWFGSMVDFDSNATPDPTLEGNDFLLAVSDTADPTSTWHGWLLRADPDNGSFADFPTLGVDSEAVYLSGDMYHGTNNPLGPSLVSFPKADLLLATPTISNRTWFGVMSYGARGQILQPAVCLDGSSAGRILATSDIGNDSSPHSNLVSFAVQNAGGPGASLSASKIIPTTFWQVPDSAYLPVPTFAPVQPDGTSRLQANEARFSARVHAVGGMLYAVHNTELNGHIAIRWYRVRAADNALLEWGTIADADLDLFFPSIAANAAGVVVIGFNGCSTSTYISCYAMAGQTIDGVTTFGSRVLLHASTVNYHDLYERLGITSTSRWGDYSTATVDPSDPNRFWTIQMYASGEYIWATQISELITVPLPVLTMSGGVGTNVVVSWPSGTGEFQLETATNLASPIAWSSVTQGLATNGALISVSVPASGVGEFFRLKK